MSDFTNYQLYRTLPKLGGDVMWDLVVSLDSSNNMNLKEFHLRPISDRVPFTTIKDEYLLNTPHRLNLKDFYKKTKSYFFNSNIDPSLDSDWPLIIPSTTSDEEINHTKRYDDTYWSGCKRLNYSIYDKTHEFFMPVWLEHVEESIILVLKIYVGKASTLCTSFEIEFKNPYTDGYKSTSKIYDVFCKYLFDYIEHTGILEGNNNIMSIDYTDKKCYFQGIDMKSGNLITRNDDNIVKNLVTRERPLIEQCSIISNAFRDVDMIVPQIFNFNIVFDSNEINYSDDFIKCGSSVYIDGVELPKKDFYTNFHYVPRFPVNDSTDRRTGEHGFDSLTFHNALDYLQDNMCLDLIHKNKISQSITHWSPVGCEFTYKDTSVWNASHTEPQLLFNVYDGFGSYYKDSSNNTKYISHAYGQISDPISSTEYDENTCSCNWLGLIQSVSEDLLELIKDPKDNLKNYTQNLSKYTTTLKFNDPNSNYRFGLALYDSYDTVKNDAESLEKLSTNVINIWASREVIYNEREDDETSCESLVKFGTKVYMLDPYSIDINKECSAFNEKYTRDAYNNNILCFEYNSAKRISDFSEPIFGSDDHTYDITQFTDFDNRFGDFLNDIDSNVLKEPQKIEWSSYYSNLQKAYSKDCKIIPHKLTVSFYNNDDGQYYVVFSCDSKKYLTFGFILKALQSYTSYYMNRFNHIFYANTGDANYTFEYLKGLDKSDFDNTVNVIFSEDGIRTNFKTLYNTLINLNNIKNELEKIVSPEIVYFNNSIFGLPDKSLDPHTKEIVYYKKTNNNDYVLRYSDNIKPAFFSFPMNTDEPYIFFYDRYGLNMLWLKDMFKIVSESNVDNSVLNIYKKYSYTNLPPKYPSVGYDSVNLATNFEWYGYLKGLDEEHSGCENIVNNTEYGILFYDYYPTTILDSLEEFKWFDFSCIQNYPISPEPWRIAVSDNDKQSLEISVYNHYTYHLKSLNNISQYYFNKIYNIYYNLERIIKINEIINASSLDSITEPNSSTLYIIGNESYYVWSENTFIQLNKDTLSDLGINLNAILYIYSISIALK